METMNKSIRSKVEVIEKFVELAKEEGRNQGKMLEILLENYLKKEANKNEYTKRT